MTNHTASILEPKGPKQESPPRFATYGEYRRAANRAPRWLSRQRKILTAILFDAEGHKLMQQLTPPAFDDRDRDDYQDQKGKLERLAELAFSYWEKHGAPPNESIYDLIGDIAGVVPLVQRLECDQRAAEAQEDREPKRRRDYDEDVPAPDCRGDRWRELTWHVEHYNEAHVVLDVAPADRAELDELYGLRRKSSGRKHKAAIHKQRIKEMLAAGKSRKEIAEATTLTAGRISQIAMSLEDEPA